MTQILSSACLRYAMQVSDRLVTRDATPVDFLANKSMIVIAADGVVTLSFTGRAFLDGVPTDQWIAEVLRGARFDRARKPPAISFGPTLAVPDVGRNLERVRKAIQDIRLTGAVPIASFGKWYGEMFAIAFAGWQWYRKKRPRPILGTIEKPASSLNATIRYLARSPFQCRRIGFSPVPEGHATRAEFTALYGTLGHLSETATEAALVGEIRRIATKTTLVGPDCISVALPQPGCGPIRVSYFPIHENVADLVSAKGRVRIRVAFSPWILAAGLCHAPSILNGNWHLAWGGIEIVTSLPESAIAVLASQERPSDPTPTRTE